MPSPRTAFALTARPGNDPAGPFLMSRGRAGVQNSAQMVDIYAQGAATAASCTASGTTGANVASAVKSPGTPQSNCNVVTFGAVSTSRLRVQVTHASGFKTALTEVKVYNRPAALG